MFNLEIFDFIEGCMASIFRYVGTKRVKLPSDAELVLELIEKEGQHWLCGYYFV
jgi:hypothetical protein